ncbi:MAG: hypothetical protein JRJ79_15150, partial [Deltaproteobacteria bacterium]|nr:hypothetical protein [Deltaproteobacteria bacterium]
HRAGSLKSDTRLHVACFIIIALVSFIIYSNTLNSPFVFDDINNIVENTKAGDLGYYLSKTLNGTRSFVNATFAINYHFNQLNVTGYHLVNIIIHVIAGFLVYLLAVLTFRTPLLKDHPLQAYARILPVCSALLFVAHPVQTQAVTYIIQRYASMAAMFYLMAMVCFIKARLIYLQDRRFWASKHLLYYGLSFTAGFLAASSKETAATLPVMILLYEYTFIETSLRAWQKRLLYLLPLLLLGLKIPFHVISHLFMPDAMGIKSFNPDVKFAGASLSELLSVGKGKDPALTRTTYLFTQFNVLWTYIRLLILPINQNLDYDYPLYTSLWQFPTPFSLIGLLLLLGSAIFIFRKHRLIAFSILWFFITLSVESSVIPIIDYIFEHRLYLPSVGYAFILPALIFQLKIYIMKRAKETP